MRNHLKLRSFKRVQRKLLHQLTITFLSILYEFQENLPDISLSVKYMFLCDLTISDLIQLSNSEYTMTS